MNPEKLLPHIHIAFNLEESKFLQRNFRNRSFQLWIVITISMVIFSLVLWAVIQDRIASAELRIKSDSISRAADTMKDQRDSILKQADSLCIILDSIEKQKERIQIQSDSIKKQSDSIKVVNIDLGVQQSKTQARSMAIEASLESFVDPTRSIRMAEASLRLQPHDKTSAERVLQKAFYGSYLYSTLMTMPKNFAHCSYAENACRIAFAMEDGEVMVVDCMGSIVFRSKMKIPEIGKIRLSESGFWLAIRHGEFEIDVVELQTGTTMRYKSQYSHGYEDFEFWGDQLFFTSPAGEFTLLNPWKKTTIVIGKRSDKRVWIYDAAAIPVEWKFDLYHRDTLLLGPEHGFKQRWFARKGDSQNYEFHFWNTNLASNYVLVTTHSEAPVLVLDTNLDVIDTLQVRAPGGKLKGPNHFARLEAAGTLLCLSENNAEIWVYNIWDSTMVLLKESAFREQGYSVLSNVFWEINLKNQVVITNLFDRGMAPQELMGRFGKIVGVFYCKRRDCYVTIHNDNSIRLWEKQSLDPFVVKILSIYTRNSSKILSHEGKFTVLQDDDRLIALGNDLSAGIVGMQLEISGAVLATSNCTAEGKIAFFVKDPQGAQVRRLPIEEAEDEDEKRDRLKAQFMILEWDIAHAKLQWLPTQLSGIGQLTYSPDGKYLSAVGYGDYEVWKASQKIIEKMDPNTHTYICTQLPNTPYWVTLTHGGYPADRYTTMAILAENGDTVAHRSKGLTHNYIVHKPLQLGNRLLMLTGLEYRGKVSEYRLDVLDLTTLQLKHYPYFTSGFGILKAQGNLLFLAAEGLPILGVLDLETGRPRTISLQLDRLTIVDVDVALGIILAKDYQGYFSIFDLEGRLIASVAKLHGSHLTAKINSGANCIQILDGAWLYNLPLSAERILKELNTKSARGLKPDTFVKPELFQ